MKNQHYKTEQDIFFPSLVMEKQSISHGWRMLFFLLVISISYSCKKEVNTGIDYNLITEQRILEISEQASISDEDIAILERLNAQVTNKNMKSSYADMIEGVKLIKILIEKFNKLRTDYDINFKEFHAQLQEEIKHVTDKLPRKAKMIKELETALLNYNTDEIEFLELVLTRGSLAFFLSKNFNIKPIEGKPNRYLRADIERVDSLRVNFHHYDEKPGMSANVIRHFKGLKYLETSSKVETVWDFNHLKNLETLVLNIDRSPKVWELKIDQLHKLKHLELEGNNGTSPFGEEIDFTNKYPLLETLVLPNPVTKILTKLLLPNKPHLKTLRISNRDGFQKMKRFVIEGKSIKNGAYHFEFGSADNTEVEEVRLIGFNYSINDNGVSVSPSSSFLDDNDDGMLSIKKLFLKDISTSTLYLHNIKLDEFVTENTAFGLDVVNNDSKYMQFTDISYPIGTTFDWFNISRTTILRFSKILVGNKPLAYSVVDQLLQNKQNPETLTYIEVGGFADYPNKTLDLSRFKNLELIYINTVIKGVQVLEKIILHKSLEGVRKPIHKNGRGVPAPNVTLEYKE
ncbi:hypothetical protein [Sphingobacterium humi]|uniref:Leucine-rich repeat domain-containing protein n=1 Tax=Sphingobacterium humi TaxID=1796905 RepID=A0A6N8KTW1_9SPHI|nr:hypothetical protein [Sphingobacterium humi]MVZ60890.1 hypothetical protein [Sphingobacterium humi]